MATTDPTIRNWREALGELGSQLFDLENHPAVQLARKGLTGLSATTWAETDAGVTLAWDTYRAIDELLHRAESQPTRLVELLTKTMVPGPGPSGTTDPTTAMRAAKDAVAAANGVAGRLATAWDGLGSRVQMAHTKASSAGDTDTADAANVLATLLATDPLSVTEVDVADVESRANVANQRRATAQTAVARLDIDLAQARTTLTTLDADLQKAASELAHASSRVAGLAATQPVSDLAALGTWLDRITQTAETAPVRAATDLAAWAAAAKVRRDDFDAALDPARRGMERRDESRGLWKALRAKAAARRLDEDTEVAAALAAARELLWAAPCDLAAGDAALARLAGLLDPKTRAAGGAAAGPPRDAPPGSASGGTAP